MSVMETTKTQVTAIPHVVDALCHACHKCLARAVCKSKAIIHLCRNSGDWTRMSHPSLTPAAATVVTSVSPPVPTKPLC
jgi:MinD superfamily P-loop ATPase